MGEKRILIIEIEGNCRYIRITDQGMYCSADQINGWERINEEKCQKCLRDKKIPGMPLTKAIGKGAYAIAKKRYGKEGECLQIDSSDVWAQCMLEAEEVLRYIIGESKK